MLLQKCHLGIFFSCYNHYIQQRYLENSLSTHHHFSTKLMLITAQSSKTTQRLYSFKFTLVDKAVYSTAQLLSMSLGPYLVVSAPSGGVLNVCEARITHG